jgi:PAS domain S-box-containing protein
MTLRDQGLILEANLTASNLLGVDRSQLVKQPVTRFIVREDEDVYYLHRKHLFETGVRQVCEIRFRRKDGSQFWTRLEATMVQDGESKAPACRVAVSDITEYKRLEQERQAMEARLRHQQKLESIGRLAGGVAHEINNPLAGIMGFAQLIAAGIDKTSPLGEYASEIICLTERVATIVGNLLTFARHETQSHSPADIHEIVGATLALIQTVMPRDQITLEMDIPKNMPRIKCRSQQIQQVLLNLLTNARDALDEKYPECNPDKIIRVTAQVFEKAGKAWIRTTVEDHGTGISPEIQEKMFDPFFTTKEPGKGTGLGLAIINGIVEEHGGELHCESELGHWTRFHMDLPVDAEQRPDANQD